MGVFENSRIYVLLFNGKCIDGPHIVYGAREHFTIIGTQRTRKLAAHGLEVEWVSQFTLISVFQIERRAAEEINTVCIQKVPDGRRFHWSELASCKSSRSALACT